MVLLKQDVQKWRCLVEGSSFFYGYRFSKSQLNSIYVELPEGQLFFATSIFFQKHIPGYPNTPLFNLFTLERGRHFYIGIVTERYLDGQELQPEHKNPCFVPDLHAKILQKGWDEANLVNQSSDIRPRYYFLLDNTSQAS